MEKVENHEHCHVYICKINEIIDRINSIESRLNALNDAQLNSAGNDLTSIGAYFYDEEG